MAKKNCFVRSQWIFVPDVMKLPPGVPEILHHKNGTNRQLENIMPPATVVASEKA